MQHTHPKNILFTIAIFGISLFSITSASAAPANAQHLLVKTVTSPKVYLVSNNRRIHIPNPSIFEAGGYRWEDIKTISQADMDAIRDTALIKSPTDAKVYLIKDGKKAWVPNQETFLAAKLDWGDVVDISQAQVNFYQTANFEAGDAAALGERLQSFVAKKSVIENKSTERKAYADVARIEYLGVADLDGEWLGAINDNGQIIGYTVGDKQETISEVYGSPEILPEEQRMAIEAMNMYKRDAFLWKSGKRTLLNSDNFRLKDINNRGQILGDIESSYGSGALWNNGNVQRIPRLSRGVHANAYDMSDQGVVVGSSDINGGAFDAAEKTHAFMWKNGVSYDLGSLGGKQSVAYAINNSDMIVGASQKELRSAEHGFEKIPYYPVVWENKKIRQLSEQPGKAIDVNNNGDIIGTIENQAVLWKKDGKEINLQGQDAVVRAINDQGDIVGVITAASSRKIARNIDRSNALEQAFMTHIDRLITKRAVLWREGKFIFLDSLLPEGSTVHLSDVHDINNNGQAIVRGFDDDRNTYNLYVLQIPEQIEKASTQVSFDPNWKGTVYKSEDAHAFVYNSWKEKQNPSSLANIPITIQSVDPQTSVHLYYYDDINNVDLSKKGTKIASIKNKSVSSYSWNTRRLVEGTYMIYAEIEEPGSEMRYIYPSTFQEVIDFMYRSVTCTQFIYKGRLKYCDPKEKKNLLPSLNLNHREAIIRPEEQNASTYKSMIEWKDEDNDHNADVHFYYFFQKDNNTPFDYRKEGREITSIKEDMELYPETGSEKRAYWEQYEWDMTDLPAGKYYLYATIDDGIAEPVRVNSWALDQYIEKRHESLVRRQQDEEERHYLYVCRDQRMYEQDAYHSIEEKQKPCVLQYFENLPPSVYIDQDNPIYQSTASEDLRVDWFAIDYDSEATVYLYYQYIPEGTDVFHVNQEGTLFAELEENDRRNSYIWNMQGLPAGSYYLYAIIDDGVNDPVRHNSRALDQAIEREVSRQERDAQKEPFLSFEEEKMNLFVDRQEGDEEVIDIFWEGRYLNEGSRVSFYAIHSDDPTREILIGATPITETSLQDTYRWNTESFLHGGYTIYMLLTHESHDPIRVDLYQNIKISEG